MGSKWVGHDWVYTTLKLRYPSDSYNKRGAKACAQGRGGEKQAGRGGENPQRGWVKAGLQTGICCVPLWGSCLMCSGSCHLSAHTPQELQSEVVLPLVLAWEFLGKYSPFQVAISCPLFWVGTPSHAHGLVLGDRHLALKAKHKSSF